MIRPAELKQAKRELFGGIMGNLAICWSDKPPKQIMTKGNYFRSGARGCRYHATSKEHAKFKHITGINKPALASPYRIGDSEIGHSYRTNMVAIKKYTHYKRLGTLGKILYYLTLQHLPSSPFDYSLSDGRYYYNNILNKRLQMVKT